jgi:hypothetical protein
MSNHDQVAHKNSGGIGLEFLRVGIGQFSKLAANYPAFFALEDRCYSRVMERAVWKRERKLNVFVSEQRR